MKVFVNLLTIFRLSFTIVLVSIKSKMSEISFIIAVVLLFFSDYLDGLFARKFRVQTFFGSIMDTIADKVLSIILYLILIDKAPIIMPVLLCEIVIAIVNIIAIVTKRQPKSTKVGKVKMWFVCANVLLGYLYYFNIIGYLPVVITSVLTFILGIMALINYSKALFKKPDKAEVKHKLENMEDLLDILFNTNYYLSTL